MFEVFEHTADFGIRASAGSLDELFVDAAKGLFSMMVTNLDSVRADDEVRYQLDGDDIEGLLHGWLRELLYTFSADRWVLTDFHVRIEGTAPVYSRLVGSAKGEPIDLSRHQIDVEVKAITWHSLKVERPGDQWLAEVIVDV